MASCVRNIRVKNYRNLITDFQVIVENVGIFLGTRCINVLFAQWWIKIFLREEPKSAERPKIEAERAEAEKVYWGGAASLFRQLVGLGSVVSSLSGVRVETLETEELFCNFSVQDGSDLQLHVLDGRSISKSPLSLLDVGSSKVAEATYREEL